MGHLQPGWTLVNPAQQQALSVGSNFRQTLQMTIEELYNKLAELQIPEDRYYLHGLYGSSDDNDKIALTIRKGKYTIEYETYFKERGEKHSIRTFTNEDEVSNWLLKKLVDENEFWKSQRQKPIDTKL